MSAAAVSCSSDIISLCPSLSYFLQSHLCIAVRGLFYPQRREEKRSGLSEQRDVGKEGSGEPGSAPSSLLEPNRVVGENLRFQSSANPALLLESAHCLGNQPCSGFS